LKKRRERDKRRKEKVNTEKIEMKSQPCEESSNEKSKNQTENLKETVLGDDMKQTYLDSLVLKFHKLVDEGAHLCMHML